MTDPHPVQLSADHYDFVGIQNRLLDSALADLGEPRALAHEAVGYLSHMSHMLEIDQPADEEAASHLRRVAVYSLAGIGIRTARALMMLVDGGWEPESHALKRRLLEARLRMQETLDDPTGNAARSWLNGSSGGVGPLARQYDSHDPWRIFCAGAHADVRSLRLSMVPPPWIDAPSSQRALLIAPNRDNWHAAGLLLDTAWDATLMFVGLAQAFDSSVALATEFTDRLVGEREKHRVAVQRRVDTIVGRDAPAVGDEDNDKRSPPSL